MDKTSCAQTVTFAIGDIHGELEKLECLHASILEEYENLYSDYRLSLIHLGDYIDRGPDGAGVISCLIKLSERADIEVVCLAGNHEDLMISALRSDNPRRMDQWLINGGDATLSSYDDFDRTDLMSKHRKWLETLPKIHLDEDRHIVYVHAGVLPHLFPVEDDEVYMWTRSPSFLDVSEWRGTNLEGWTVIHGHTPTSDFCPEIETVAGTRVNVDTGAVFGGKLTCAVIAPGEPIRFLHA